MVMADLLSFLGSVATGSQLRLFIWIRLLSSWQRTADTTRTWLTRGSSVLLIMAQLVSFFWPAWSKASFSSVSWLLFPHISLRVALLLQNSEREFWKPLFFLIPAIWRGNDEVLCVWDLLFFLAVSSLVQFESTSDCQIWQNINSAVGWHTQVESWGTSWTN